MNKGRLQSSYSIRAVAALAVALSIPFALGKSALAADTSGSPLAISDYKGLDKLLDYLQARSRDLVVTRGGTPSRGIATAERLSNLLTFSLINDGLEAFNADFEPKDKKVWLDEWLRYGVKRVPTLAEEVKNGTVKVANRGPERGAVRVDAPASASSGGKASSATNAKPAQQPALFDFAKGRRAVELAGQQ